MTTPTNDRQTSERERLATILGWTGAISADKAILDAIHRASELLRADEAEIAALRAENEALRTVTTDDACAVAAAYANAVVAMHAADDPREVCADPEAMLTAIQSFIRSKESRRG